MELRKVLNNNSLLVLDDSGREAILLGRGIAFGFSRRRPGAFVRVPEECIEKRFVLPGGGSAELARVIEDIPYDRVILGARVVQLIRSKSAHKIGDGLYLTLIDHVNSLADRLEAGISFDPALLGNIRFLYREEYELGLEALAELRKGLGRKIDDSEASFIAMHIVNAELDSDMSQVYAITSLVEEIVSIVRERFPVNIDSMAYDRFVAHCRFFARRIIVGTEEPQAVDVDLLPSLVQAYPEALLCVDEICQKVKQSCQQTVSPGERLYLALHLIRLTANK